MYFPSSLSFVHSPHTRLNERLGCMQTLESTYLQMRSFAKKSHPSVLIAYVESVNSLRVCVVHMTVGEERGGWRDGSFVSWRGNLEGGVRMKIRRRREGRRGGAPQGVNIKFA